MIFFVIFLCFQFVLAETTFFEGDLGYGEDFIMESLSAEIVGAVGGGAEVLQGGGGGYFVREEFNQSFVCETCIESLREHIIQYQDIDYSEEEVIVLTEEINQEFGGDLSNSQVRYVIENFEEECDAPYPILGGFAGGRFRDLITPMFYVVVFAVLILFLVVVIVLVRILKTRRYRGRLEKK